MVIRTIDLSRHGIAVLVAGSIAEGEPLKIVVEEARGGHRRLWQWRGRVVSVRAEADGHRVGIEFSSPEVGPEDAIRWLRAEGRDALIRLDPAWTPPDADEAEGAGAGVDFEVASPAESGASASRLATVVALAGFLADQFTKALAFAPAGGRPVLREVMPGVLTGIRVQNGGSFGGLAAEMPLASTLCGLVALGLIGLLARWAVREGDRWSGTEALGWGLLMAGMFGNIADRLTLGYVRDFLHTRLWPAWVFNLADVMTILGALMLLGVWALALAFGSASSSNSPGPEIPAEPSPRVC